MSAARRRHRRRTRARRRAGAHPLGGCRVVEAPARRRRPKLIYGDRRRRRRARDRRRADGAVDPDDAELVRARRRSRRQQRELTWQKQILYDDVAGLSSPQYLAANASALGMVIDESPSYLRLSDGALLGAGQAALGASSVDAIGRGAVPNALITDTPLVTGPGRDDRGRARREPTSWSRTAESRTLRRPSPTDCPPRAHTEHMTTRSTRSPRRRTVVALAVVLAVLAGFIVRLVDIQVVNADEHIARLACRHALGGSRTLYGTRGEIVDETGQTLAGSILLYDCQLDPLNVGPDRPAKSTTASDVACRGRRSPPRSRADHGADGRGRAEDRRRRARRRTRLAVRATSSAGLSTEQYRALADTRRAVPHLRRSIRRAPIPTARSPATSSASWAPTATRSPASSRARTTASPPRTARSSYQKGKDGVVIPGTEARAARRRRRHAAAHDQPRPAVVPAAADRRAGAGHGRQARRDHGRRGRRPARSARPPSTRRVDPNDVDASDDRRPRQPHLHATRSSPARPSRR